MLKRPSVRQPAIKGASLVPRRQWRTTTMSESASVFRVAAARKVGKHGIAFVLQFPMNAGSGCVVAVHGHRFQAPEELLQLAVRLGLARSHDGQDVILLGGATFQKRFSN